MTFLEIIAIILGIGYILFAFLLKLNKPYNLLLIIVGIILILLSITFEKSNTRTVVFILLFILPSIVFKIKKDKLHDN